MQYNIKKYKEMSGTIVRKTHTLFGYHFKIRDDNHNTASVIVGKGLYDSSTYCVGAELTVGYISHQLINIRPGKAIGKD